MTAEYTVTTTCPHCGHSAHRSHDAHSMRDSFGNDPTIQVLCTECRANFEQPMELACAEWDDYCRATPLPADV